MDLGIEVSILKKQVEMPLAQIWSDIENRRKQKAKNYTVLQSLPSVANYINYDRICFVRLHLVPCQIL